MSSLLETQLIFHDSCYFCSGFSCVLKKLSVSSSRAHCHHVALQFIVSHHYCWPLTLFPMVCPLASCHRWGRWHCDIHFIFSLTNRELWLTDLFIYFLLIWKLVLKTSDLVTPEVDLVRYQLWIQVHKRESDVLVALRLTLFCFIRRPFYDAQWTGFNNMFCLLVLNLSIGFL